MKQMGYTEEARCWECGEYIFAGQGYYLGDENPDVSARSLCNKCIDRLIKIRKGR